MNNIFNLFKSLRNVNRFEEEKWLFINKRGKKKKNKYTKTTKSQKVVVKMKARQETNKEDQRTWK